MNRRHRFLKRLSENLCSRWQNEYLSRLQLINNHREETPHVDVGDLVIVTDDKKPRSRWPLGKIIQIIRGRDQIIRMVKLKGNNREYFRPIQHVIPLEVKIDMSSFPYNRDSEETESLSDSDVVDDNDTSQPYPSAEENSETTTTRTGRTIRKPERLDL
jgi:hypothetical protein